jgi:hypothetical protein
MKKYEAWDVISEMINFLFFITEKALNTQNLFIQLLLVIVILCIAVSLVILSLSLFKSSRVK